MALYLWNLHILKNCKSSMFKGIFMKICMSSVKKTSLIKTYGKNALDIFLLSCVFMPYVHFKRPSPTSLF